MQDHSLRNSVKELYPHSSAWAKKVDRMSREQVFAIFKRSQEEQAAEPQDDLVPDEQLKLF